MKKTTAEKKKRDQLEEEKITKPQTDVKDKEESPEDRFPPFPKKNEKESLESLGGEAEPEVLTEFEIEEVCGDVIAIPFELWGIFKKGVEPLSEKEKKGLGKPFARLAIKYHVQDYMKDEFYFLFILGVAISKRVKVKKDVSNHSGEKRKGEDESR